jgi:hypothetical protein
MSSDTVYQGPVILWWIDQSGDNRGTCRGSAGHCQSSAFLVVKEEEGKLL